jgi:pimeloyl-ACP methyl ester carboxylesterase
VTYGEPVTRSRRLTAIAMSVVSVLGAVAVAAPARATTPAPLRGGDSPAGLAAFYGQALDWTSCTNDMQCAWLTVPLDYADPTGPTIRLSVSRVRASGPAEQRQGSLVVNPGGPGASGTDFASYVAGGITPRVATQFDVVGFDPRGVGSSEPITCLTGRQTTRWLRADPAPDTSAEERRLMSLADGLARGCLGMSPQIARHVGSENTVRDLDILRAVLGDARLNFLGFSYGTYLGTMYAEQFPTTVGRFVLDGALDPSLDIMQVSEGQSKGFQTAISRFARDCVGKRSCPWKGPAANVIRGLNRLIARIDRTPLPTHGARDLVVGEALSAIFYSLYSPLIWSTLRSALKQANVGDGRGLQTIADYAAERTGPNTYGSNMASAFPAISCWDSPAAPDAAGLRAASNAWAAKARVPDMARAMAWGNATCAQWYGHSGLNPAPASSSTTAPILIVGTTYDPATPYVWARALHDQLTTSTLITFLGDGHTAYGGNSTCIDGAVDQYLLTGVVPAPGTVCR